MLLDWQHCWLLSVPVQHCCHRCLLPVVMMAAQMYCCSLPVSPQPALSLPDQPQLELEHCLHAVMPQHLQPGLPVWSSALEPPWPHLLLHLPPWQPPLCCPHLTLPHLLLLELPVMQSLHWQSLLLLPLHQLPWLWCPGWPLVPVQSALPVPPLLTHSHQTAVPHRPLQWLPPPQPHLCLPHWQWPHWPLRWQLL